MRSDCSLTIFDEDSDYEMDSIDNPTDWSETNQKLTRTLSGLFTVVSIENHGSGSMKYSRQNLIGWLPRDQKPGTKESDSGSSSRGGLQVQDSLDLESNQLLKHQSNIDQSPSRLSRFLSQFTVTVNCSWIAKLLSSDGSIRARASGHGERIVDDNSLCDGAEHAFWRQPTYFELFSKADKSVLTVPLEVSWI